MKIVHPNKNARRSKPRRTPSRGAGVLVAAGFVTATVFVGVSAGVLTGVWAAGDEKTPPLAAPVVMLQDTGAREVRYTGVGSCTAAGCHGGRRRSTASGSIYSATQRLEYLHWISDDPHSRAYATLYSADSQKILAILDQNIPGYDAQRHNLAEGKIAPEEYLAALEKHQCLACHAVDGPRVKGISRETLLSDGVSCEACHGAAEHWLGSHSKQRSREGGLTPQQKAAMQGMVDIENITVRAQKCASCHVGSPGKDVNHVLIAAGHPALQFEFLNYMQKLPKHWQPLQDREWAKPDHKARFWAVGQAVAAQHALTLRADRLAKATTGWPEFAELDCSACHHDLQGDAARQNSVAKQGVFHLGAWYFSIMQQHEPALAASLEPAAETPPWADLRAGTKSWTTTAAQREAMVEACRRAAQHMEETAARLRQADYDAEHLRNILRSLLSKEPNDWASAAQMYNGVAALHEGAENAPQWNTPLKKMYDLLNTSDRQPGGSPNELQRYLQTMQSLVSP